MAPRSGKSRPARSLPSRTASTNRKEPTPLFPSTKKDKRQIKHAKLLSKVTKPSTAKPRRRRPNKKLVATLDSLAAALPEETGPKNGPTTVSAINDQVNIIQRKSIKSRPGALKRREKADQGERERFAKNMAQMAVPSSVSGRATSENDKSATPAATSDRWAALRGFISQTLQVLHN